MRYVSSLICCLLTGAILLCTAGAQAQSSSSYAITKNAVAGGGGSSSSASYAATGTAGQPAAGTSSAGSYALTSGFWYGGAVAASLIFANLKAQLEGPYSSGSMTTRLNSDSHLPTSQPYSAAEYDGTPMDYDGSESVPDFSGDRVGVVDWVLVELRTGTAASTVEAVRAAFIKSDGSVVDTDGASPLAFSGLSPGGYYVVVRHRNHLPVMSAGAVTLSGSSAHYDFTTGQSQTYGSSAMTDLGDGTYGLWGGDDDADGQVTAPDFNAFSSTTASTATGYLRSDYLLDGQVTAPDFNLFSANTAATAASTVPEGASSSGTNASRASNKSTADSSVATITVPLSEEGASPLPVDTDK